MSYSERSFYLDDRGGGFHSGSRGCEHEVARHVAAPNDSSRGSAEQIHLGILEREHASGVSVGGGLERTGALHGEFHPAAVGGHYVAVAAFNSSISPAVSSNNPASTG